MMGLLHLNSRRLEEMCFHHRRKSQEIPSQKIRVQESTARTFELLIIINATSTTRRSEKPKEKKEDDISLQMQEMSIDSPGILEEDGFVILKVNSDVSCQSSMDGQAMSLDFIMSSNSPYVSKSPAVTN